MIIYLAGPMTGYDRYNFDTFAMAAKLLRENGHTVLSPAEAAVAGGFDPDNPGEITPARYEAWMEQDFKMIDRCDAVCFLADWNESEGARREWAYARINGKRILPFSAGPAEEWWRETV